ncbi:hypothetical protein MKZ38_008510 [Zalerion maritima]|uniref:Uncharacterized protein n=1 Tax=Zalerion maritima TaxID=339359 RepID=A0AAD5RHE5_9PEZI|nr:hypothetical protein MKZ38_008510 [Zalerion maritima]
MKRSDDDIQFISSNPVKRRKMEEGISTSPPAMPPPGNTYPCHHGGPYKMSPQQQPEGHFLGHSQERSHPSQQTPRKPRTSLQPFASGYHLPMPPQLAAQARMSPILNPQETSVPHTIPTQSMSQHVDFPAQKGLTGQNEDKGQTHTLPCSVSLNHPALEPQEQPQPQSEQHTPHPCSTSRTDPERGKLIRSEGPESRLGRKLTDSDAPHEVEPVSDMRESTATLPAAPAVTTTQSAQSEEHIHPVSLPGFEQFSFTKALEGSSGTRTPSPPPLSPKQLPPPTISPAMLIASPSDKAPPAHMQDSRQGLKDSVQLRNVRFPSPAIPTGIPMSNEVLKSQPIIGYPYGIHQPAPQSTSPSSVDSRNPPPDSSQSLPRSPLHHISQPQAAKSMVTTVTTERHQSPLSAPSEPVYTRPHATGPTAAPQLVSSASQSPGTSGVSTAYITSAPVNCATLGSYCIQSPRSEPPPIHQHHIQANETDQTPVRHPCQTCAAKRVEGCRGMSGGGEMSHGNHAEHSHGPMGDMHSFHQTQALHHHPPQTLQQQTHQQLPTFRMATTAPPSYMPAMGLNMPMSPYSQQMGNFPTPVPMAPHQSLITATPNSEMSIRSHPVTVTTSTPSQPQSYPPPRSPPKTSQSRRPSSSTHAPHLLSRRPSPTRTGACRNSSPPVPPQPKKHSPNLIVDVAETCLATFPFSDVAERHSVPVHKVKDIFNGIIQLPLLRCPTDKRRQGKLGSARMKEYHRAKKDYLNERGISTKPPPPPPPGKEREPPPGLDSRNLSEVAEQLGPLSDIDARKVRVPWEWGHGGW